jgi:2-dehydropantoate 2-reductase
MKQVLIVGSGAMGCRFGAALFKAGYAVCLYDVSKPHVDAINRDGLLVHSQAGVEKLPIFATYDVEAIPAPDLAIVFTKTMYTESALGAVGSRFLPATVVLTLQNGLGNIEKIARYVDEQRIIVGITTHASDLLGPGEIEAKGSGITRIMPLHESSREMSVQIAEALNAQNMLTELSDEIMKDIWEKVAFNAAFNTTTAITMLTVGQVGASEWGRALLREISSDVVKVANNAGVPADEAYVHSLIESQFSPSMSGDHKPSMLQDRLAGRRTEIESICGEVLRVAQQQGIDVPHVKMVYQLVRTIENNYLNNK